MRIIAGAAKGKRIEAPPGRDTRPTLDRVREALFGAIQFDIPGCTALDLFSGSGALGLEAASRGAAQVYCNDHSPACAALIQKNAAAAHLTERITVWRMDYRQAVQFMAEQGICVDMAFLDPPYADSAGQEGAKLLFQLKRIRPGGFVIVEHAPETPPTPIEGLMRLQWTRKYGDCALSMLKGDGGI